jgi:Protein of unknown function (DUF2851)
MDSSPSFAHVGRCASPLALMPQAKLLDLLESAARHRMNLKAERLRRIAQAHGVEEALFQAVSEALGYSRNTIPFRMLAQRLPLKRLLREASAESLLFGHAGILDEVPYDQAAAETKPYLRQLWEHWWKHRTEDRDLQPPLLPWQKGVD